MSLRTDHEGNPISIWARASKDIGGLSCMTAPLQSSIWVKVKGDLITGSRPLTHPGSKRAVVGVRNTSATAAILIMTSQ
jgi:hypothetical protein